MLHILGDIHRQRGELSRSEEAYRRAVPGERVPYPGLALLRLAQGQIDSAGAAIRHVAEAVRDDAERAPALDGQVEIALAGNDVAEARRAAGELGDLASRMAAPILAAASRRAARAASGSARRPTAHQGVASISTSVSTNAVISSA